MVQSFDPEGLIEPSDRGNARLGIRKVAIFGGFAMKRIVARLLIVAAAACLGGCSTYYASGGGTSGGYSGGGYVSYGAYGPGPRCYKPAPYRRGHGHGGHGHGHGYCRR